MKNSQELHMLTSMHTHESEKLQISNMSCSSVLSVSLSLSLSVAFPLTLVV